MSTRARCISATTPGRSRSRWSRAHSMPIPRRWNGSSARRTARCAGGPTTASSTNGSPDIQARTKERPPMTALISTEKLTKSYGSHRGIIEVDLEVREGEAFGFLGPNGAGKTTMIRTLLDHIRPTSGRATIFGIDTTADPVAIHKRLGYLPGEFALYDKLTGGQTLDYFANLRGGIDKLYQADLIARLDVDPSRK